MRNIKYIVIHCTAGSQTQSIESIQAFWRNVRGWNTPGYHHIIKPSGEIVDLLPINKVSNGVAGHNSKCINIAYIGGVDKNLKPVDNRTEEQKKSILELIAKYKKMFPSADVRGHRDFEGVRKDCPSFDVKSWLASQV